MAASTSARETPRDRARRQTMADITRIGREHLARDGAAALSLRAVARDLGVVSSAVYRYVANRDDLLTLLVVDAYTELADAVDLALDGAPADIAKRMALVGNAMRDWAVSEPSRWSLLYGSPVPGYAAPAEQTTEPGTRVMRRMVVELEAAQTTGALGPVTGVRLGRELRADLKGIASEVGSSISEPLLARGLFWWSAVIGAISTEVFGQLGEGTVTDPGTLFDHHLNVLATTLGLAD